MPVLAFRCRDVHAMRKGIEVGSSVASVTSTIPPGATVAPSSSFDLVVAVEAGPSSCLEGRSSSTMADMMVVMTGAKVGRSGGFRRDIANQRGGERRTGEKCETKTT